MALSVKPNMMEAAYRPGSCMEKLARVNNGRDGHYNTKALKSWRLSLRIWGGIEKSVSLKIISLLTTWHLHPWGTKVWWDPLQKNIHPSSFPLNSPCQFMHHHLSQLNLSVTPEEPYTDFDLHVCPTNTKTPLDYFISIIKAKHTKSNLKIEKNKFSTFLLLCQRCVAVRGVRLQDLLEGPTYHDVV